jgi:hypothetical protein
MTTLKHIKETTPVAAATDEIAELASAKVGLKLQETRNYILDQMAKSTMGQNDLFNNNFTSLLRVLDKVDSAEIAEKVGIKLHANSSFILDQMAKLSLDENGAMDQKLDSLYDRLYTVWENEFSNRSGSTSMTAEYKEAFKDGIKFAIEMGLGQR